ncbi:MAG: cupredoxin domain-containing protein [Acidimicrobiales bacterium]
MALRLRVLVPVVALLGLTAACGGGGNLPVNSGASGGGSSTSQSPPSAVITIKFVSFEPGKVTIHAGQTVEWKWEDSPLAHNVTFAGFASPLQVTGTYFHTFGEAGTYPYRCTIHASMTGVIKVLP